MSVTAPHHPVTLARQPRASCLQTATTSYQSQKDRLPTALFKPYEPLGLSSGALRTNVGHLVSTFSSPQMANHPKSHQMPIGGTPPPCQPSEATQQASCLYKRVPYTKKQKDSLPTALSKPCGPLGLACGALGTRAIIGANIFLRIPRVEKLRRNGNAGHLVVPTLLKLSNGLQLHPPPAIQCQLTAPHTPLPCQSSEGGGASHNPHYKMCRGQQNTVVLIVVPSMAPVCASRKYRHHDSDRRYSAFCHFPLMFVLTLVPSEFAESLVYIPGNRQYSHQPALRIYMEGQDESSQSSQLSPFGL